MVRCDIADMGQVMHEGSQEYFIKTVGLGNKLTVTSGLEFLEPFGELAKRHHLAISPDRRQGWLVIGLAVVVDKGLLAPVYFLPETAQELFMDIGVLEIMLLKKEMTTVTETQLVGKLCSKRDLNPFYGFKHQQPEFAVKNIEIKGVVKGGAGLENML